MTEGAWVKELKAAITVCDRAGVALEMNDRAAETYEKDGGRALIGKSLLDCHPERAREIFEELLRTGSLNVYTIEKNGVKIRSLSAKETPLPLSRTTTSVVPRRAGTISTPSARSSFAAEQMESMPFWRRLIRTCSI